MSLIEGPSDFLRWALIFGFTTGGGGTGRSSNAVTGCRAVYLGNLDATYDNGPQFDGVGATLTFNNVGFIPAADGVTLTTGDRVLVKDQGNLLENGIYLVQSIGSGGSVGILVRARDYDTTASITVASYTAIGQGSTLKGHVFVQQTKAVVVGTSDIVFNDADQASLFSPENAVYVAVNGVDSGSSTGELFSQYATPGYASDAVTGALANPKMLQVSPGEYANTTWDLKPDVGYVGTLASKWTVTDPIVPSSAWSSAVNQSSSKFYGLNLVGSGGILLDFSSLAVTGTSLQFFNSFINAITEVIGADANPIALLVRNTQFVLGVTLRSLIATFYQGSIDGALTIADKGTGSGATNVFLVGTVVDDNVTITGASGRASVLTCYGATITGNLTIDGTFADVYVDEQSYPRGTISYINGATSAQLHVTRGDVDAQIAAAIATRQPLSAILTAMTMNIGGVVYAGNNGSNSNNGTIHNAYSSAIFGSDQLTGSQSIPRLSISIMSNVSATSFALKPNVWLLSQMNSIKNATAGNVWSVTNPITLDSSWTSAAANSAFYMTNIKWSSSSYFDLDFSLATNGVYWVSQNCQALAFLFQGAASHIPNISLYDSQDLGSGVDFNNVNSNTERSRLTTITYRSKASGGATTHELFNSVVTGGISLSGNTGGATVALTIRGTPIAGSITISGTTATLVIDQASYPAQDIIYTNGATQAQVTRVGTVTPQPNIIIGGNFDTNAWQRGTTFTSVANGTWTADNFQWTQVGSGVVDIKRTADAPSVAVAGIFSQYCYHVDVTTADASIAATDQYSVKYAVEGVDFADIAQRDTTFTIAVKAPKTGIYTIGFTNDGGDRYYAAEYTINAANTWEIKKFVVPASPSAGTWDYSQGGTGLIIMFYLAAGSNFFTTTGAWQTTGGGASANQVNAMDSTSNDFKMQIVKLEQGVIATPYPLELASDVLRRSQRYYQKSYNPDVAPATATNTGMISNLSAVTSGALGKDTRFKVDMAYTPTVQSYDGAGNAGKVFRGADNNNATIDFQGTSGVRIYSASGASVGTFQCHYTAAAPLL